MKKAAQITLFFSGCFALASCGGSSDSQAPILPSDTAPTTAIVSFSVSDAPSDSVVSVNVTFDSITLKSSGEDADDDSGINIPIVDGEGNKSSLTINLMDFQDGESKLIIENTTVAIGHYDNLILNTVGCPQNQNGNIDACWVEDIEGKKPLKTPSNKLKLGEFSVSSETEQAYNIEFNLRSSMTTTANSASYNLKPHGIRIVNEDLSGSLIGVVDVNLLTAGEACETVFEAETDHGKIVYLYKSDLVGENILGDEFDSEVSISPIPENVIAPFASDSLSFDAENDTYNYSFNHLEAGRYIVAFSCSAVSDNPEEYDALTIPNPDNQFHEVDIVSGIERVQDFSE